MHTTFSDGKGTHREYIDKAIQLDLSEAGFSDHICLRDVPWAVRHDRIEEMSETVQRLKKTVCGIQVKFGIEMDYFPDQEERIARMLESLPLDYVIGSVHFLGDWNFDSSATGYENFQIDRLHEYYFSLVAKAARSGLFDIIGHVDLIKKFNFHPESRFSDYYAEAIRAIKEAGIAVEMNTSGMDMPCREFYPSVSFLEICKKNDIPITLGSDAHKPGQVGRYFEEAFTLLLASGYRQMAKFTNRNMCMADVPSDITDF